MSISGNFVGSYSPIGKTFIITDEDGVELVGTVTEQAVTFDATPDDVKIGKTFVSDEGVGTGIDTRTYRTTQGSYAILPGTAFSVPLEDYDVYDYTKFQCLIAKFNTTFTDSVSTDKVSINDNVHSVNSVEILSNVTKNTVLKSVDLNITNDTDNVYIIHYFTYKEEA